MWRPHEIGTARERRPYGKVRGYPEGGGGVEGVEVQDSFGGLIESL